MDIGAVLIPLLTSAFYVLVVMFVFGVIIFVHELGHFVAAKKVGIRVEAFSLGFGPVLIGIKRGETEYRLSLIPVGGYVKMAGENVGDKQAGLPDEFNSRTVGERAIVVLAGVATHVAFAFLLFILAFRVGVPFVAAEVGAVEIGSPAWVEGLEPGDEIVAIDGSYNVDYEELICASALNNRSAVALEIKRGAEVFNVVTKPEYDEEFGTYRLGIQPQYATEIEKILGYPDEKNSSPAIRAGLQVGDVITHLNGAPMATWQDLSYGLRHRPDETIQLTLERDGQVLQKEVLVKGMCTRKIIGISGATTVLRAVRKRSAAYDRASFREGDRILAVNGTPVQDWADFSERLAGKEPVSAILVQRGGKEVALSLKDIPREMRAVMLQDLLPDASPVVTKVVPNSPAEAAGIKPEDRIISINGRKMGKWDDIIRSVTASEGAAMKIVIERDGALLPPISLAAQDDPASRIGAIGIMPAQKMVIRQYGLWESCIVGCRKAVLNAQRVYLTLRGLVTKRVAFKNIGGPILIAQASYYSALQGMGKLLYFVAVIAINLAVVNLIPIPLLDGGLLVFLLVEKIKGSPLSEGAIKVAQYVGLALLLTLMVFVFKNDIIRLLQTFP